MSRLEQDQMGAEYQRLKKAYADILQLLNEKTRKDAKG